MKLTKKELIEFNKQKEQIASFFKNDSSYGFDKPIDEFFLLCKTGNPQSYGLRAEKYFALTMGYEVIPSSLDLGDFYNLEGEAVEFKCSFLSETQKKINIKQVRIWQDLQYYYIFSVDFTDYENIIYKCYKLSAEVMNGYIEKYGRPCHSTKSNNDENEKVEMGFSFHIGSKLYHEFEEKYLLKRFDIKKLADKRLLALSKTTALETEIATLETEIVIHKSKSPEIIMPPVINIDTQKYIALFERFSLPEKIDKITA